eukprot:TRINITY_DN1809_c0_g5_i1.p2 TRINITY_DN1809_c0_g5~~TRINITY_DN1809_c0_g5_i1.p2  ORF type:complete len:177 (-),score=29.67 TRINITY_DN1809_c0_g5_i1:421-951(-)
MSGNDGPSRNPEDKSPPPTPPSNSPLEQLLAEQQNRERGIQQMLQSLSEQQSAMTDVVRQMYESHAHVEQNLERYDANFTRRIRDLNTNLDSMIRSTLALSQQSRSDIDQQRIRFETLLREYGVDLSNREMISTLIQILEQINSNNNNNNNNNNNQGGDQQGGSGASTSAPDKSNK